jgi:hypothetical protein
MFENKTKLWAIVATVLAFVFIVTSGLLYVQNNDLGSKKDKLSADLTSTRSAKSLIDKQLADLKTNVGRKLKVLQIFSSGNMTQENQFEAYSLIKQINNDTITANYKATQNNTPGGDNNNSWQKFTLSLISESLKDVK